MTSYRRVLRHRDFRYLFLGQSASAVGDQVVIVALALYITQRTGSPTDLGLVLGAQSLPLVGAGAVRRGVGRPAAAPPDHDRRRLRPGGAARRAGGLIVPAARVWQMVVIEALFGAARAFFQPAYSGLLPQTVPEELIQDARALTESMANLASCRARRSPPRWCSGSAPARRSRSTRPRSCSAPCCCAASVPGPAARRPQRETVLHELRAGWREVRSRTWVWVTIAVFTGAVLCVYAQWYALAPVIARDLYGARGRVRRCSRASPASAPCWARSLGHPLAARASAGRRPAADPRVAGPVLAFALGAPLAVVVVLAFGAGFGLLAVEVWWETALARHIPPQRAVARERV